MGRRGLWVGCETGANPSANFRTSTGTGRSIPHWDPQAFCLPTGAREATTDPIVGTQTGSWASPDPHSIEMLKRGALRIVHNFQ